MKFVYDDGGRALAGFKGKAGDCACRAISIATGHPYQKVYDMLNRAALTERPSKRRRGTSKRRRGTSNARTGVHKHTFRRVMEALGWQWVPTMTIGSGCKVHMRASELPPGRLIVNVSRHYAAVIDGVLHDTHDCTREGSRCVYGYFIERRTA